MLSAGGYLDWAIQAPGIPDKVYTQRNSGSEGIACHSIVGSYLAALGRFLSEARLPNGRYTDYAAASVQFINCKDGDFLQLYSVDDSAWTSGGPYANCNFWSVESEGGPPGNESEPLTEPQTANMLRLAGEYETRYGRAPVLLEHREIAAKYGYAPTACASNRYAAVKELVREGGLSMEDKQLLATLADIVCRNGMQVERREPAASAIDWSKYKANADGTYLITGDDCITYARAQGFSFALGLAQARQDIGALQSTGGQGVDIDVLAGLVAAKLEIKQREF